MSQRKRTGDEETRWFESRRSQHNAQRHDAEACRRHFSVLTVAQHQLRHWPLTPRAGSRQLCPRHHLCRLGNYLASHLRFRPLAPDAFCTIQCWQGQYATSTSTRTPTRQHNSLSHWMGIERARAHGHAPGSSSPLGSSSGGAWLRVIPGCGSMTRISQCRDGSLTKSFACNRARHLPCRINCSSAVRSITECSLAARMQI
jgi:hypothetical protein